MANQLHGNVLLVEDDEVNQMVIKGLLILLGCNVSVASRGQEALDMLTDPAASYEVVIMDVGLPDMSGKEVTQKLRNSSCKLKAVPVIALTGQTATKDQKDCIASGMNSFIAKPTTKEILYQELKQMLV
jgi:CheY-like chemotaxis protein